MRNELAREVEQGEITCFLGSIPSLCICVLGKWIFFMQLQEPSLEVRSEQICLGPLGIKKVREKNCKREGDRLYSRICYDRTRGNGSKLEGVRCRLDIRIIFIFFYSLSGKALEHAAQKGGGCPILGDIQGQAGWGSEHLMEL